MDNSISTVTEAELTAPIQGHDHFLADLAKSLSGGRMHHAWLLTGPVGIGKASMARLAAAWLLSEQTRPGESGGMDSPNVTIDARNSGASLALNGAHPDYKLISPLAEDNKSGQIKIDQIR